MSINEGPTSQWAEQRRQAAVERARLLRARQEAEHSQASALVTRFLAAARQAGLEPVALRVKGYNGGSASTGLRGWYLRSNETVALSTEGSFYVLTMPLGLRQRLLGASPAPEPVPLVLGEGGRDGDVLPLTAALDRLLPGWQEAGPQVPTRP